MKRRLIGMAVLTAMILGCMTGCAESSESSSLADSSVTSADVVDATNTISEESSDIVSGNDDNGSKGETTGGSSYTGVNPDDLQKDENGNYPIDLMKLVPDATVTHPDVNFGLVTIEENEIDMFSLTNAEFIEKTLTTHEGSVKYTHNTSDFYFKGHSFCRGLHNPMIFLEYLTAENTLLYVKSDPIYKEKFNGDIYLKGFSQTVDDANDNYEYVTYYGGVRLNMRREEIEAVLGEGTLGTDTESTTVIYKSNTTTMVIVYKMTDEYIAGETEVADAIFVIKND